LSPKRAQSNREAAELFGVSHSSINAWRKAYQSGKLGPGSKELQNETLGVRNRRLQEHILELKAEIGDLYLQNQLLKKAIVTSRQRKKENSSVIKPNNLDQFQEDVK
jgi:transposase-like protein